MLRQGASTAVAPESERVRKFRRRTAEHHLRIIERHAARGSLLDVGTGEGYFLQVAHERGWKPIFGVDVADAATRETRQLAEISRGTVSDLRFTDSRLDVVTLLDSLEHVVDPLSDLREIARILKPKGLAYIVTPDGGGPLARLMGHRWFQLKPSEHLFLFSRKALRLILSEAGFVDFAFSSAPKYTSLSFVTTILSTTNPRLAQVSRQLFSRLPCWNAVLPFPTDDLCVMARVP